MVFFSITRILVKKASLSFKVVSTIKSLSEQTETLWSKFCEQIRYARRSACAELDHIFFLRHLKRQRLKKMKNLAAA